MNTEILSHISSDIKLKTTIPALSFYAVTKRMSQLRKGKDSRSRDSRPYSVRSPLGFWQGRAMVGRGEGGTAMMLILWDPENKQTKSRRRNRGHEILFKNCALMIQLLRFCLLKYHQFLILLWMKTKSLPYRLLGDIPSPNYDMAGDTK